MNDKIDICFSVNEGYVEHLSATIISILRNESYSARRYRFNILVSKLFTDDTLKRLRKDIEAEGGDWGNVVFHVIDASLFKGLGLAISYITKETYYRYLIPNIISQAKKAIYLDADLVLVGKGLTKLWNIDIDDFYMAGVEDSYVLRMGHKEKIGLHEGDCYVNAGVLLLNLEKMRKENKVEELIDCTLRNQDKFEYQDQDALNVVFKGKVKSIPVGFNVTSDTLLLRGGDGLLEEDVIVHFTGKEKPWGGGRYHTKSIILQNHLDDLYYSFLNNTRYPKKKMSRFINKVFWFFYHKDYYESRKVICLFGVKFK